MGSTELLQMCYRLFFLCFMQFEGILERELYMAVSRWCICIVVSDLFLDSLNCFACFTCIASLNEYRPIKNTDDRWSVSSTLTPPWYSQETWLYLHCAQKPAPLAWHHIQPWLNLQWPYSRYLYNTSRHTASNHPDSLQTPLTFHCSISICSYYCCAILRINLCMLLFEPSWTIHRKQQNQPTFRKFSSVHVIFNCGYSKFWHAKMSLPIEIDVGYSMDWKSN